MFFYYFKISSYTFESLAFFFVEKVKRYQKKTWIAQSPLANV